MAHRPAAPISTTNEIELPAQEAPEVSRLRLRTRLVEGMDTAAKLRKAQEEIDGLRSLAVRTSTERAELREERDVLKAWINDLQSGMYVNCVYCGHRYGPREDTPVSMADVLKEHIEQCPQHPLSATMAEIDALKAKLKETLTVFQEFIKAIEREQKANHLLEMSELTPFQQDHWKAVCGESAFRAAELRQYLEDELAKIEEG